MNATLVSERRLRVILAFAAVYLIWGSTYLAIRFAIETLPPFLMAGARFLTSGTILYLWARHGHPAPTRTNWGAAALIGALLLLVGNGGVVWAEQRIPSGLAALLVAVEPLWVVVLVWARGTPPGGRVLLGLAVGFAGLFLLISAGGWGSGPAWGRGSDFGRALVGGWVGVCPARAATELSAAWDQHADACRWYLAYLAWDGGGRVEAAGPGRDDAAQLARARLSDCVWGAGSVLGV